MKKRKLLQLIITAAVIIAALTAVAVILTLPAGAETEDYYTYSIANGEATITGVDTSISGDIIIPSNLGGCPVTGIGDSAFEGCSNLTSITIPDSVTKIGDYAFFFCLGLESIIIPDSVTNIGSGAFSYCTNLEYTEHNNGKYLGNTMNPYILLVGVIDSTVTSFDIPNSTKIIDCYAFDACSSLISITIPNSVTSVGDGAFYGCSSLTSITIPDSVTSIGDHAFYNCSSLEYTEHNNGKYLGNTINPCVVLIEVIDNTITSFDIPDSTKFIYDSAFFGCSSLTSINIPDSVRGIGLQAFCVCSSLTSITVDVNNKIYHSANDCLIETESKTLILGCENSIIPTDGSVTRIGDSAFFGCSRLTSITIPDSVTSIGSGAFSYCLSLTSITADVNNKIYHSANDCLIETESKTLILGCENSIIPTDGSVTRIGDSAFSRCYGLRSISIPDSVTSIGDSAFFNCIGGVIQTENGVSYVDKWVVDCDSSSTQISIRDNTVGIGDSALSGCKNLTSITIPDSVKSIGYNTFYSCTNLESVKFGENSQLTSIGDQAFYECSSLKSINIPDSIMNIGDLAFLNCLNIDFVNHENGKYLGNTRNPYIVFVGVIDDTITSFDMPDSTRIIYGEAFFNCTNLSSITIPDSVTSIGVYTFNSCTNLETIYFCGSEDEWNAIEKAVDWDYSAGSNTQNGTYTVVFNDIPEGTQPENPDETEPQKPVETEKTPQTAKPSGGCRSDGYGSSVGGGAVVIISAFVICGAMVRRRKKE